MEKLNSLCINTEIDNIIEAFTKNCVKGFSIINEKLLELDPTAVIIKLDDESAVPRILLSPDTLFGMDTSFLDSSNNLISDMRVIIFATHSKYSIYLKPIEIEEIGDGFKRYHYEWVFDCIR